MSERAERLNVTDDQSRAGAILNKRNEETAGARAGHCANCGEFELLTPLHLDRGGPLFCIRCGMDWHGKHGRLRNAGRIVIKAIKAYFGAGGKYGDVEKLKLAATGYDGGLDMRMIQLGYETDNTGVTLPDLTTELLKEVLQLIHPDHQPPERRELATRVTRELNLLKPFVFPAPKPEPHKPRDVSVKASQRDIKKPSQCYPCEDCADHVPFYYCDPCKAEWERRNEAKWDRRRAKQRNWYARRKRVQEFRKPQLTCICGEKFKPKRADAKHCSPKCRQAAYRARANISPRSQSASFTIVNGDQANAD